MLAKINAVETLQLPGSRTDKYLDKLELCLKFRHIHLLLVRTDINGYGLSRPKQLE